jgi:hypothetical protein
MKLFHQTDQENVSSIMEHGLRTNKAGWLYLTPRPDLCSFGNTTLVVETRDIRLTAFEDCKEWEVLCWDKIPPNDIKLAGEYELERN